MINVALMQYQIEESRAHTYEKIISLLDGFDTRKIDLLVLPELFSTPYFCQNQDYESFQLAQSLDGSDVDFLKMICQKYNISVSTSFFEKKIEGIYHNTAITLSPTGQITSVYRKSHIPQDPCFEEKYYFKPGSQLPDLTSVGKFPVTTAICWDQWFPEMARSMALKGAMLLNYPTAIAWLKGEEDDFQDQLDAWLTVTRSHAITNGFYVSCVNRVGKESNLTFWGHSYLCSPMGKYLLKFSEAEEVIKVAPISEEEVFKARATWPFLRDRKPELYSLITSECDL